VPPIRTVMITMSPILRDLITELIARHRPLNVVAELDSRQGFEEPLRSLTPALVLIGLARNEGDEIGLSLVRLLPKTKVIAFSRDGHNAFVYQMLPQRTLLVDVSPQMLVDTILQS
jgi:DNA-binding NarL/FixJ family response regulator